MNELKCKVCGEMNPEKASFCMSCGAKLVESKSEEVIEKEVKSPKENLSKAKLSGKSKKQKDTKREIDESKPKDLSKTKLLYFIFVLVLIGGFILYASGIFEHPVVSQTQQTESNNPHPGVDLASLEQINTFEEKLKSDPKDKELELQLAHLLNDSGLKTRAIEEYQKYLKMDPKDADVWVDMGVCYYETGKNQDAIKYMEKALTIQPRHQIANLNLGIVNMASGNRVIAIKYLKKAVEIDSTNEIGQKAKDLIKSH